MAVVLGVFASASITIMDYLARFLLELATIVVSIEIKIHGNKKS